MPTKLVAPLIQTFELTETDAKYGTDGTPTTVTIRQATQQQHEQRQQMFAEFNRVFNLQKENEVEFKESRNFLSLARNEVFLTMVDCNILDENGNALFKFKRNGSNSVLDMNTIEFSLAYGRLPGDVAQEIHSKVREVNLSWASNPLGSSY